MPYTDPEKNKECKRRYYREHKAENDRTEYQQRYRANHRAELAYKNRRHYATHSEEKLSYSDQYRTANPEVYKAIRNKWRQTHPWEHRCYSAANKANRNARRHGQTLRIIGMQVRQLWRESNAMCGICGQPVGPLEFSLDHIRAFADGGLNVIENCQISHLDCNIRKGGLTKCG